MLNVEFSEEEVKALSATLELYLSHLRVEIAHTDRKEFREALKKREMLLRSAADRLKRAVGKAAA